MKLFLIMIFFFLSCARFATSEEKKEVVFDEYKSLVRQDYVDHFKYFEKSLIENNKNSIVVLSKSSVKYLETVASNIIKSNELFFTTKSEPTFYIIKSKSPFHFSLPGKKIFLSDSLIEKYIKNESILHCLIAYELIRSEKAVYKKFMIYPTGDLPINKILSMMRLPVSDKVEVHKWAYYLLSRAGIETDSYLAWLQIKNRNSLDFSVQLGDIQSISQEESLFKKFIVNNTKNNRDNRWYKGSSRAFYAFVNNLKR